MGALGDPAQDEFFRRLGGKSLSYAGRPIASSPAVGSPKAHEAQLKELLEAAFT
jgi:2-oxoglutarate dehydrogenase complex dehydrogenase (E1) component-like enzyme